MSNHDQSKDIGRGRLRIDLQVVKDVQVPVDPGTPFGELLKLPSAYRVDEVRFGGGTYVDLWISGPGLPGLSQEGEPPVVRLCWATECRELESRPEVRVLAAWEHDLDDSWTVIDWRQDYILAPLGEAGSA